jgi:hypothetical protein
MHVVSEEMQKGNEILRSVHHHTFYLLLPNLRKKNYFLPWQLKKNSFSLLSLAAILIQVIITN